MLNTDSDVGRHLALGNYILNTHHIPTHDIFSFTKAGQARPPYEWVAQVIFAAAFKVMGLDGVVAITALLLAAAFLFVYKDCVERSSTPVISLVLTVWAAAASSLHWLTRPHIFSLFFLVIWLGWLEKVRRGKHIPLWVFPGLMMVWANTHGGFVYGLLAWGAYLAGWMWEFFRKTGSRDVGKSLLITGTSSIIASMITPAGWQNWAAVLNNRNAFILSHTVETMPPRLTTIGVWPFAGMLILSILVGWSQRRRINSSHFFLLTGLGVMSLSMARNIPFFVVASAPILAEWLSTILVRVNHWKTLEGKFMGIDQALAGFIWPALVILGMLGYQYYHDISARTSIVKFNPKIYPVQAANWVSANHPRGNMFNDFNWGGYLLYRLWPEQHVFIDSQSDFYGETFLHQYADIMNGARDWDTQLKQYNVDWLLIPPSTPLATIASQAPNWHTTYQDDTAIILVRRQK